MGGTLCFHHCQGWRLGHCCWPGACLGLGLLKPQCRTKPRPRGSQCSPPRATHALWALSKTRHLLPAISPPSGRLSSLLHQMLGLGSRLFAEWGGGLTLPTPKTKHMQSRRQVPPGGQGGDVFTTLRGRSRGQGDRCGAGSPDTGRESLAAATCPLCNLGGGDEDA